MGRLLVVTSGKGGAGKSTVAAGLGMALSHRGHSVLLVDMDEGLRCLDFMLGVSETTLFDLGDVLAGNKTLQEAMQPVFGNPGFLLLAAPAATGMIRQEDMERLSADLCRRYDYVIFDCPAGVDRGFRFSLPPHAQALVVVNPEPVSVRDASVVERLLEEMEITPRLMVLNRFDRGRMKSGVFPNIDSIIDESGLRLAAVIPEDQRLAAAFAAGIEPKKGRALKAFARLAARLDGEAVPLPKPQKI